MNVTLVYTTVTFMVTVSTPMDHFRAPAGLASMETVHSVLVGERKNFNVFISSEIHLYLEKFSY